MAEIEVQKRKDRSVWPLLLGLLVLALLIWGAVEMMSDDDDELEVTADESYEVTPQPSPVAPGTEGELTGVSGSGFAAWVRDSTSDAQAMGREHEFTREGIRRMTAALSGLVARDSAPELQQRFEQLRSRAGEIARSDATSAQHSNQAKQAFTSGVELLTELGNRPHLRDSELKPHVDAARQAAESIDAGVPLLEQKQHVRGYFDHMAQAIQVAERHMGVGATP